MTSGFYNPYHLDGSTFIFRGTGSDFVLFLFHFSMNIKLANRIAPDWTSRFAASHLGLFCLPMSHKKETRQIWVKLGLTCKYIFIFFSSITCNTPCNTLSRGVCSIWQMNCDTLFNMHS